MADDIVTRLRRCGAWLVNGEWASSRIAADAADEIERLRAACDALAKAVATHCGDEAWADRALKEWQEARRG